MRSRLSVAAALIAAAGVTLWAACDDSPTASHPDSTTACTEAVDAAIPAALAEARSQWEAANVHDYVLEFAFYCYCSPAPQPYRVWVQANHPVEVRDMTGAVVAPEVWADWNVSVLDWFDLIEAALANHSDFMSACFDADLGYPRRTSADPDRGTADEEWGFEVSLVYRN